MKKKTILFLIAILVLSVSVAYGAETQYYAEETFTLDEGETILGDIFVFARTITINGTIQGEAFLCGNIVNVNGDILGDAFVLGNNLFLGGTIGGNTRVMGSVVNLPGTFSDEVIVGGADVNLTGTFSDIIYAGGATIIASGQFQGDVRFNAEKITLKSGADFSGEVNCTYGDDNFTREEGVTLDEEKLKTAIMERKMEKPSIWSAILFKLIMLVGFVIVGLVLNGLFPAFVGGVSDRVFTQLLNNLGWGVVVLLISPIAIILLLITVVGIPLALLWSVAFGVCLYLGKLFVAIATGGLLLSLLKKDNPAFWIRLIVGAIVVSIIAMIPIVSFLIGLLICILGLGALIGYTQTYRKDSKEAGA